MKGITLTTMRADLSAFNLPFNLYCALVDFDGYRQEFCNEDAQRLMAVHAYLQRLQRGMRELAKNLAIIRNHCTRNGLNRQYVTNHIDYFTDLTGLFYFNGCDKLVAKLLMKAWQLGKLNNNRGDV